MEQLLSNNPLLLLFVVAAVGYFVGKVKIKGNSLGVSAVLFVGLAFGAINPDFNVPKILFQLGIVFFVYSVGLSSGPAFFKSFKKNGIRDIGFVMVMLTLTALIAVGIFFALGLDAASITGIYSGSTTNTPALASVLDLVDRRADADAQGIKDALVIGYTYSYPMGVIGVMLVLKVMEKVFKIDYDQEKELLRKDYALEEELTTCSVQILNEEIIGHTLRDITNENKLSILFGRIASGDEMTLATWDTVLRRDDELMLIGGKEDLKNAVQIFGVETEDNISSDRKEYDIRRIFVSNPRIVGRTISSLNLNAKYSAVITRIRRGDIDMLAKPHTVLEMGDRIRFIARRKDLKGLSKLFGDSYYKSSEVNLFSFGLGIAIGLLIGSIQIPLPGGTVFKLGMAGGPLVVGLVLGALRRTGPIVWTLPYGANVTLRQMGLIFLLAVIGLSSGNKVLESLGGSEWVIIALGGALLSILAALLSIIIGYKVFKIPFSLLLGFLSNQPAILDFATDMSKNKVPVIGYSVMFPIALVMKILFAQLLFLVLGG
ncbi:MAG: aspartate:alanine exchanger family transporter [Saprospiraceae bacterium]|nr:aspartate:alanine exchanger family transporter [Saprospiraceae bacterium]